MADIDFYRRHLQLSTVDAICSNLTGTLIETNFSWDFFVNWSKAIGNRDVFRYELALLKSLRNSSDPISDLRDLFRKYPEVIKVIPLLIACRDGLLKVLDSLETGLQFTTFDFSKKLYDDEEIEDMVSFTEKTGLLEALCHMDSATDYLLGVEVGLDTNARKNRSGLFLEKLVTEVLYDMSAKDSSVVSVAQKTFAHLEDRYGIRIPPTLRDRKFDYVVISKGKATNIEVNFYGGTGSKPSEIVNSYINRAQALSSEGWRFVWLTDGQGWRKMQNQLRVGIANIDYVINAKLLRDGLLEKVIA